MSKKKSELYPKTKQKWIQIGAALRNAEHEVGALVDVLEDWHNDGGLFIASDELSDARHLLSKLVELSNDFSHQLSKKKGGSK